MCLDALRFSMVFFPKLFYFGCLLIGVSAHVCLCACMEVHHSLSTVWVSGMQFRSVDV